MILLLLGITVLIVLLSLILVKLGKKNENYQSKITMSMPEWQQFVGNGMNTLLLSGGVIPGGTSDDGVVYNGNVRPGY